MDDQAYLAGMCKSRHGVEVGIQRRKKPSGLLLQPMGKVMPVKKITVSLLNG
jgi:hypothetical protein